MNLTPEEKFNQEVWWILQEIKNESFLTPKGEKVEFSIRISQKNEETDYGIPNIVTQRKLLNKLKDWGAIDDLEVVDDILRGGDVLNPKIYKLSIKKPKFDEIYNKVKKHFLPPKKVIPEEWIERLKIPPFDRGEELLSNLYKAAKNSQSSYRSSLGAIDDIDENVSNVIDDLKKRKLITYKTNDKVINTYTESGDVIPYDMIEVEIKFNPEKLINHLRKPLEAKKIIVGKLARYYLNLIRIIEVYFKNPQKLDDKLNKSYEIFCEAIRILIYENNISSRLGYLYKKPFNSLFSAERELENKKITLKDKVNSFKDFYGEIQKLLLIYDVSEKQSDEISNIENYLNEIEAEERIKEEVVPETPSAKIEITKMPELKIKKSEKLSETKKKQIKETALYLNQNGDLYREPKEKYCYPMGERSNRHRIIRFLSTNKGYQLTEFISTELGIESEKTIRTEIGKMRNNIKNHLKIDGKDLLQGKKESGYRINLKYKITFKNE